MTALRESLKYRLGRAVLSWLFLPAPVLDLKQEKIELCRGIWRSIGDNEIVRLPGGITKLDFLSFLGDEKQVLFHGSNQDEVDLLQPVDQENYRGEQVQAVFASRDPIWAMFFAVLDRERYHGSLRNGSFIVSGPGREPVRYYFFSINQQMFEIHPWRPGTVYVLPSKPFSQTSTGVVRFDEWTSNKPVTPLARVAVSPEDFPFIYQVSAHEESESIYRTWLLYKQRLKRKSEPKN
jgi:hypothetical protein